MSKSAVVITKAKECNYQTEYVALPKDYGTPGYFEKEEVKNIIKTVTKNLKDLDKEVGFTKKLKGKKVLIKPNLVAPYVNMGYKDYQYPESTDPRVFDAVVSFVKQHTDNIVIVESSGRGMPTQASFEIAGYDRIAKRYNTGLIALEEQPVDRYMLPKAKVMREIYIPRIFSEIVSGDAFYISVPKMKTNLYTGVTLGCKNAMGTIPYNLRQRNHNYDISKKLVDMLYLFKPDLVVIDGIIGGEGNTPAPVDPVDSRVIISGNNGIEADWVATEFMGIDPNGIELMTYAKECGFGDDKVKIIGEAKPVPFRKADQSLISDYFNNQFPNVKVLIGHTVNNASKVEDISKVTPEKVREIEKSCVGGCTASLRTGFDDLYYQGKDTSFSAVFVMGTGTPVGDEMYYFDRDGNAYTVEEIKKMEGPIVSFGSCSMKHFSDCKNITSINGCMPKPGYGMSVVHKVGKSNSNIYSPKNKQLGKIGVHLLKTRKKRIDLVKAGEWVDCVPSYFEDKIYEIPELTAEQKKMDFIPWPLPKLEGEDQKRLLKDIKPIT